MRRDWVFFGFHCFGGVLVRFGWVRFGLVGFGLVWSGLKFGLVWLMVWIGFSV